MDIPVRTDAPDVDSIEARITIHGRGLVELRPEQHELPAKTINIDHSRSLELIKDEVKRRHALMRSTLILIEGDENAGKTILAELLAQSGVNAMLIAAGKNQNVKDGQLNIAPLVKDTPTLIFDEPVFIENDSFEIAARHNSQKSDGVIVILTRSRNIVPELIRRQCTKYQLTHDGLFPIKE